MRDLIDLVRDWWEGISRITDLAISDDGQTLAFLVEGKWIDGRFSDNIRIDEPKHRHGEGQPHAHVYGRKGVSGGELVIVNLDGTASHRRRGRLSKEDADSLRAKGFKIRADNMVEWFELRSEQRQLLFEAI